MNIIQQNQIKALKEGKAIVCVDYEWAGVEHALFRAQEVLGKEFPQEAQWFLNRLGAAIIETVQKNEVKNG